jgi:ABC-type amino acid transport substrate-binding protein
MLNRKVVTCLIPVTAVSLSFTSVSQAYTSTAHAAVARALVAQTAPAGKLRVLVFPEDDRPQFFSVRADTTPGFEREILESFARSKGLTFEVVPVPRWEDLIPYLRGGAGDVIAGHFTDIPARRALVDFSAGVLPTRSIVITRKPHRTVTTLAELREERIGVVQGSAARAELIAAGVPPVRVVDVTPNEVLDQLREGKISAHIRSLPEAVLAQRADPAIQLGMAVGPASHFAFALRKDDGTLRESLDAHLEIVRSTGAWNRLVAKYFGDAALGILKDIR